MKIHNLGSRIMNTYLYPIACGYAMIDTGYENSYGAFLRKLQKLGIKTSQIKYVFLTHAHDDHAGYLNELLTHLPQVQVIASQQAIGVLLRGQNSFEGGCPGPMAWLFCNAMKLLGKGSHKFPPIDPEFLDRFLLVGSENQLALEEILQGKIIPTPGHTGDSLSLLLGNGALFCGDAAMNGFPSLHKITIWVGDQKLFGDSWRAIIHLAPAKIYPAHGRPFLVGALQKNLCHVEKITLHPLGG